MAHLTLTNAATDELVECITGFSPTENPRVFKHCKDVAIRNLRYHRFGRTNQFAVQHSIDGLVEKFRVFDKDALADALSERLNELGSSTNKWKPELLSLLLNLSDNPAVKTDVGDLEKLKPADPPPLLTWDDIIADDPQDEEGLWDDIDYASISSEDDVAAASQKSFVTADESTASSVQVDDSARGTDALRVKPYTEPLRILESAQRWRSIIDSRYQIEISETQAVREVLHVLHGLPSVLFRLDKRNSRLTPCQSHCVGHMSSTVFDDLLHFFADISTQVNFLREYTASVLHIPLQQTFAASVASRVQDFDSSFLKIEQQLSKPEGPVLVSLLNLRAEVEAQCRSLLRLKDVAVEAGKNAPTSSYRLLERLFDCACSAQSVGDDAEFEYIALVFLECLQTYLKPIQTWMESGEIDDNDGVYFIRKHYNNGSLSTFWNKQYSVAHTKNVLQAPHFLRPAIAEIFASGKNVAFLRELGLLNRLHQLENIDQMDTTLHNLHQKPGGSGLLFFSDQFTAAMNEWINSKHQRTSTVLCKYLLFDYGLWRMIDALETIFLSREGSVFQLFADRTFTKLDIGKGPLHKYAVEDIARDVFRNSVCIDPSRITSSRSSPRNSSRTVQTLANIRLDYRLPDVIQNIIPPSALVKYQSIFTLLLQIYRVLLLLSRRSIPTSTTNSSTAEDAIASPAQQIRTLTLRLRHRILYVVTTLQTYILQTCVAPSSLDLRQKLANADGVDSMIAAHATFITSLERKCLLTPEVASVHSALVSLLDLAISFSHLSSEIQGGEDRRNQAGEPTKKEPERDVDSESDDDPDNENNDKEEARASAKETTVVLTRQQHGNSSQSEHHLARLQQMQKQHAHLLSIVVSGLRTASRGDSCEEVWQSLADMLDWGKP